MSESTIAILNQYPPDKYNVLAPETMTELSPWHQITISQVKVNPVIPQGEISNGQVYKVSGGKLAPHKETILRLADAAGGRFKPTVLKRYDDGSFEANSIVEKQDPDGTWRQYSGSYFWNVPERIAQAKGGEGEAKMIRKFSAERAESGAMLRAVRGMIQLKGAYTAAELAKPFIIARVSFNPWNDPEIARMYRAAIATKLTRNMELMYGPGGDGDPLGIDAPAPQAMITDGQARAADAILETIGVSPPNGNGDNGGPIWEDEVVEAGEEHEPEPDKADPDRPYPAHVVRGTIRKQSGVWQPGKTWADALRDDTKTQPPSDKQVKAVASLMAAAVTREGMTQADIDHARHAVLLYCCGVEHTDSLSKQEAHQIIELWKNGETWEPNQYAAAEATGVVTAWQKVNGQAELL